MLTLHIALSNSPMIAVVELGSKQYRVIKDQILYVELTGVEAGKEFNVEKVLLVDKNSDIKIGKPLLKDVTVTAKVLDDVKAPKIHGFKYHPKKNVRKRWGHRQKMQKIQITAINA